MKTEVQLTEKRITTSELANTDHVGFVDIRNNKGFVVNLELSIVLLADDGQFSYNGISKSTTIKEAIDLAIEKCSDNSRIERVYKFDTRKELYQGLAED